ncbi:MAG: hypothetical protein ABIH49_01010 [archaeon]
MAGTIDMQAMRHLNLFNKITRISTRFCFNYNNTIFFCVPRNMLSRAIGENGSNIKKMNEVLRRKIKVIASPRGIEDAKRFIESIVSPVTFRDLTINGNEITISAGTQSKAALIGRDKRRLLELQNIAKDFFGKELRII